LEWVQGEQYPWYQKRKWWALFESFMLLKDTWIFDSFSTISFCEHHTSVTCIPS
jgi:hypothetical protein